MFSARDMESAIELASAFVARQQQADGGFLSFSSPSDKDFADALPFASIFSTALILQNTSAVSSHASQQANETLRVVRQKAAEFLLAQKSTLWTWNYWLRDSAEAQQMPYPDDLDDTFCAVMGLWLHDQRLVTGEALASVVRVLTLTEQQEGGPYRTWCVPPTAEAVWRDTDIVVNANIAAFLKSQDIELPQLRALFEKAIARGELSSPYYPNQAVVLFFLARAVTGREARAGLKKIARTTPVDSPLNAALVCLSLAHLRTDQKRQQQLAEYILDCQNLNGSWKEGVFYTGVNPRRDAVYYAGSVALTTSYCVSALEIVSSRLILNEGRLKQKRSKAYSDKSTSKNNLQEQVYGSVLRTVHDRFQKAGSAIDTQSQGYLDEILHQDQGQQIALLPYMFATALGGALGGTKGKTNRELIVKLGAASVYGWLAYTIYDDFLDEEGKIAALPVANVCLRELTLIFHEQARDVPDFSKLFQKVMDRLEAANTWEVTHCRADVRAPLGRWAIPDYGDGQFLADRSMGHALGSVVLLMHAGYEHNSMAVTKLLEFYKHFIIAKQLNDDAHDWEADLAKGHINSVASWLLPLVIQKNSRARLNKKILSQLQHLFWHEGVEDVCQRIEAHVRMAHNALQEISAIVEPKNLQAMVDKQQQSVVVTRRERKKALEFLAAYNTKS